MKYYRYKNGQLIENSYVRHYEYPLFKIRSLEPEDEGWLIEIIINSRLFKSFQLYFRNISVFRQKQT